MTIDFCNFLEGQPPEDEEYSNPFPGQVIRRVNNWIDSSERPDVVDREQVANVLDGNIVTSESLWPQNIHRPVLDIDMEVEVLESSTPGHHHVFINKSMTWEQYCKLLDVLEEVGIVESGYVSASKARGYTAVRLPWIKKDIDNG
jgi:hypothetical protein